jgi:hypothetical protein
MTKAIYLSVCALALIAFLGSAIAGETLGRGVLHPIVRQLTQSSIQASQQVCEERAGSRKALWFWLGTEFCFAVGKFLRRAQMVTGFCFFMACQTIGRE